jgi:hypothetical protein
MKTTVEKLIAELTDLRVEERDLQKRLDANRQRQAAIMGSLQVKPDATEETATAPKRQRRLPTPSRAAAVLRETARAARPTEVVAEPPKEDRSAADRVREYVNHVLDDAIITTDTVATALRLKSSTVSTVLNRLAGKTIERVPGSQRGKFRKIVHAA